jgi:hypothetical protein
MATPSTLQFRSFLNGRIGGVSDYLLPDGAVTTAKNVHFDILGKVTLRPGVTLINAQVSDTYPCLGLYYFKSSTAAYSQLLSVFSDGTNNDVYYKNGASWDKTREDDDKDLKTRFTTFLDQVIKVNGTQTAVAWDGNGAWGQAIGVTANCLNLDDMDAFKGNLIENFKQRVYMAGNATNPSRLFFSWVVSSAPHIEWDPATDYVDINPNDGDKITALKKYALDLIVFKQNFMYRYRGVSGVDPEPLIKLGTYSHESVVEAKNGLYFHHPSGIYLYNGGYPQEISRPVSDFIDAIPSTYYSTISAWTDPDHVYYSIGDVTVNGVAWTNVVLRYTISSEVWTVYSYASEMRRGTTWDNGTNEVRVVGDDDGNVLTLDSGATDNGTGIQYELVTKFYELGAMTEIKSINTLSAICEKAQSTMLAWQVDDKTAWNTMGQLRKYVTLFKDQNIKGHRIRFKLFGSSSITAFIFEGLEFLEVKNEGYKSV